MKACTWENKFTRVPNEALSSADVWGRVGTVVLC
jgi:hypothetical protein